MSLNSSPDQQTPKVYHRQSMIELWQRLIEPVASIQDKELRRLSRTLNKLLIMILPLIILVGLVVMPIIEKGLSLWQSATFLPALLAVVVSIISYGLNRFGQYRFAVGIYIFVFVSSPWWVVVRNGSLIILPIAILMLGGVMMASVFSPGSFISFGSAIASTVGVALLPLTTPDINLADIVSLLSVIATLNTIILIFTYYRNKLENERQIELRTITIDLKGSADYANRRNDELIHAIICLSTLDFSVRAPIGENGDIYDALATGLNALGEELNATTVSQAYLDEIITSMINALIVITPEGTIKTANRAVQVLLGYTEAELVGQPVNVLFAADTFEEVGFDEIVETGVSRSIETKYRAKNGHHIPVSFSASVMRDERDQIQGIVCVAQDISKRVEMEDSLRKVNRAYQTLSDCNQVVVRATDEEELLQAVCRVIVEVGGYPLAWVGYAEHDEAKTVRPVAQIGDKAGYLDTVNITWADTAHGRGSIGTAVRTGKPQVVRQILTDPDYEPWRAEATEQGYVSSIALPLFADSNVFGVLTIYAAIPDAFDAQENDLLVELAGDLAFGIMVLRTRADREEKAIALKESEVYFRSLIENALDIVTILNRDGTIRYESPAIERVLGYKPDELIGESAFAFIHPDDLRHTQEIFADRIQQAGPVPPVELRFLHKDGSWRVLEVLGNNLIDDPIVAGVIMNSHDITERKQTESALRESEERLSKFINSAENSYHILDADLKILEINRGALEAIYLADPSINSKEDVVGQDFEQIYPFLKDEIPYYFKVIQTGAKYTNELTVPHPKLGDLVISSICFKVGDGLGIIAENISERRRAEDALKISEGRATALLKAIPDLMFRLDRQGVFLDYMAEKSDLYAQSEDTIIGLSNSDIAPPEFVDLIDRKIKQTLDSGEMQTFEYQMPIPRRGSVDYEARMVKSGADEVTAIVRDVTERKRAEVVEARLSKVLDDSLNEIYTFDAETLHFIQVNQGAQENLGYSMAELERMTPLDLKPEFTSASFARLLAPLRTGEKEKAQFTTAHRRRDGSLYPVEAHLQLSELGTVPVFVAIVLDITERKQTEELIRRQDRLSAVGQLAAGIAHDFNNVMAVITLYSQMLLKSSNLTEKEQQRLQVICQQANRAADLTGQILDFSRQSVMERQPIDLLPFLREFTKLLERTLPEHIKINLDYGEDAYVVNADSTRIQQSVMNLAINARDAMPDGGELRIELEQVTIRPGDLLPSSEIKTGKWVKLAVTDNGAGISPDVLSHLFEPFFTTKPPGQGTGLGLAQVHGIVKQHDGHIDVQSQVGHGTTFTLYLPALSAIQPEVQPLAAEASAKGKKETILIVEDNTATREALADGLELMNYQVLTATNGQEALVVLAERRDEIALVLSDVVMPEMGGMELLQTMKQREIDVPVVMLTGHPMGEALEALRAEGLREWLLKPVTLDKLAEVVARVLSD